MRWFLLPCLLLLACGDRPVNHIIGPPNFVVPEAIAKNAPELQEHYYKLLIYTSDRFPVKPEFVFFDLDRMIQGQIHPHVVAMQLVHVAYWKAGQISWSGSVLLGLERGWMGFSERGYSIRLAGDRTDYAFTFTDGDRKVELHIDPRVGQGTWHELDGGDRIYLYHCPMPQSNKMGPEPGAGPAQSPNPARVESSEAPAPAAATP